MGGCKREERLDKLESRMKELHMETEGMEWYLNLRRYVKIYHSLRIGTL